MPTIGTFCRMFHCVSGDWPYVCLSGSSGIRSLPDELKTALIMDYERKNMKEYHSM